VKDIERLRRSISGGGFLVTIAGVSEIEVRQLDTVIVTLFATQILVHRKPSTGRKTSTRRSCAPD
jgi:hypothetical protein